MPAPSLGPQPKEQSTNLKLRPKQMERNREDGMWGEMDERLEGTGRVAKSAYYGFTASEEEMYGVLSVITMSGNVVKLLSEGVRSAEEARDYLSRYNLDDLIVDRSAFTDEALRKNVRTESFVRHSGIIKPRHDPSDAVDAVIFAASPLGETNHHALNDILEGKISYDDIKRIGSSKLKPWGRVEAILPLLRKLKQRDAPCTVDDIKEVIAQCSAQRIEGHYIESIMNFIEAGGIETAKATPNLMRISSSFSTLDSKARRGAIDPATVFERTKYAVTVTDGVNEPGNDGVIVTENFFDAGIPTDIAIEAINNGGGITEARILIDARKNGVNSNFSDGWL